MSHQFSMIPKADIQRSSFNRSHGYKTTLDAGYLVPFFVDEVVPGDTFNLRATLFGRLATPVAPFMDNVFMETFFFFVPNRLVWDNWNKFCGEQIDPGDSTDFLIPVLADSTSHSVGSLGDYFGIPTGVSLDNVNVLPFRAYNLIYNEWFRDENLQNSLTVNRGDGPDSLSDYSLKRRGKRHDYFTSSLPFPQKSPGVELPLGTTAPVIVGSDYGFAGEYLSDTHKGWHAHGANNNNSQYLGADDSIVPFGSTSTISGFNSTAPDGGHIWPLYADLSQATAATINSLREAFALQRFAEKQARGGSRYTEIIRSHFGVVSPDARLQRPEYLGGSSSRLHINPVAQTSSTDVTTPQGNLSAFGVVGDSFHGFTKSFTEHGYIIGLVNVRADLSYQQGLNRLWSRQTVYDFYWPSFAHLGEQEVYNREIYAQGTSDDAGIFGYQERYAEYRYYPSMITGKFRSTYSAPLDMWHLAQNFSSLPTLNSTFIEDNPPIDRVVAVQNEPHFLLDVYFDLNCVRPMPVYSVPGLIDHF
ncbi:MAG: major capsid protein [Bacteroidia bacterium]|nr:major capsid protein [Bacteroidia bacterium]